MEFKAVPPSHWVVHSEFWAGPYAVVRLNYACNQMRVQVWYKEPDWAIPDVLETQF